MTTKEAIEIINTTIEEFGWNFPMDYIVAFEIAKKALEKQIPKNPLQACGHATNRTMNFCPICGQALKLSRGEKIEALLNGKGKNAYDAVTEITDTNKYGISISKATMSDILNDKDKGYSYKIFLALADYFNVSIDYLLTDEENKTTDKKD